MRKVIFILAFLLLWGSIAYTQVEEDCVPGQVIVKFRHNIISLPEGKIKAPIDSVEINSTVVQALCDSIDVQSFEKVFPDAVPEETPDLTQIFLITFGQGDLFISVYEAVEAFEALSDVIYADPNIIGEEDVVKGLEPNDPHYANGDQWALYDTPQGINAPEGWEKANDEGTLGEGIVIAIIEQGVDVSHEDLSAHATGGESGYIGSHGTIVAGVAAAVTNNSKGIAGMGWKAKFMPFKNDLTLGGIVKDIKAAADANADVINMSFSCYSSTGDTLETLCEACKYAYGKNSILVTSAGNNQHPIPYNAYPQAYGGKLVISVGATTNSNPPKRAGWSNYGPWLDVMASGENIFSTVPGNKYGSYSGTSLSCPLTAGVIALMRCKNIGYTLPPNEAWDVITGTARDMAVAGRDDSTGYGLIDAKAAFEHTWVGVEEEAENDTKPVHFHLFQNSPNPFNPTTTIDYDLPEASHINLVICNVIGQKVKTLVNSYQKGGHHSAQWNGRDMSGNLVGSGIYFYRIKAGNFSETKRMLLLR